MNKKLNIFNRALKILGLNSISSLDDTSKEAEECNFFYPMVKAELIESYPFKVTRKKLDLNSTYNEDDSNLKGYKYRFLLPFDFILLRVIESVEDFDIDGIYIYCNSQKITIDYLANIEEDLMDTKMLRLLSIKLALELSYSLVSSPEICQNLTVLYNSEFQKLSLIDSLEGGAVLKHEPSTSWLNHR